MVKKVLKKLALASCAFALMLTAMSVKGMKAEAAFDAPYYNININGGTFDGTNYVVNGMTITDAFFCDGQYTYFLQADGTPMKERLTYHPDGEHIIYFDAAGHEVFNDFTHVSRSIAGDAVDDECFFNVYGYMYVNVLTYDKSGSKLLYANPYGVLENKGVFAIYDTAENYTVLAGGCTYGYANEDGSIRDFYKTYEDAVNNVKYDYVDGVWRLITSTYTSYSSDGESTYRTEYTYDENGNIVKILDYEEELYSIINHTYDGSRLTQSESITKCYNGTIRHSVTSYQEDGTSKMIEHTLEGNDITNWANYKIINTIIDICETKRTDSSNGYTETEIDYYNQYNGDMEELNYSSIGTYMVTYENGRVVESKWIREGSDGQIISLYGRIYEFEDLPGVYNESTNTTDYVTYAKEYYYSNYEEKTLLSSGTYTRFMTDDYNGTYTQDEYDGEGKWYKHSEGTIENNVEEPSYEWTNKKGTDNYQSVFRYEKQGNKRIVKTAGGYYGQKQKSTVREELLTMPTACHPAIGDQVVMDDEITYNCEWVQYVKENENSSEVIGLVENPDAPRTLFSRTRNTYQYQKK